MRWPPHDAGRRHRQRWADADRPDMTQSDSAAVARMRGKRRPFTPDQERILCQLGERVQELEARVMGLYLLAMDQGIDTPELLGAIDRGEAHLAHASAGHVVNVTVGE
jgi:hypothetical protein